ncbi:MAG: hypothetical protein GEV12_12310 [Micromonosporaceae bacterium]|nr:hypothetical protein [Micromonosporaceae bacterium]
MIAPDVAAAGTVGVVLDPDRELHARTAGEGLVLGLRGDQHLLVGAHLRARQNSARRGRAGRCGAGRGRAGWCGARWVGPGRGGAGRGGGGGAGRHRAGRVLGVPVLRGRRRRHARLGHQEQCHQHRAEQDRPAPPVDGGREGTNRQSHDLSQYRDRRPGRRRRAAGRYR